MDFHSVMETFAEAWVAANTHTPLIQAAEQGLINGPSKHGPINHTTPNHGPPAPIHVPPAHTISSHAPPAHVANNIGHSINTVLQDVSNERREIESSSESENCRAPGHQSPTDLPGNCSGLGEIKSPFKTVSNPQGKSLPVHCIVEQIPGPQACGQYVELDSYAIVPHDTLFNDLVRTALGKLGYSTSQIVGAKGSIQVKKWKPLAFDQITDRPEATVGDILGELTTVASLHVRLYSVPDDPQEWKDITVRNAVLELLREMSQSKLAKLCPLSQPMLSNIINNRYMGKIGKEKCQEFGLWYLSYRKQHSEGSIPEVVPTDRPVDGRLTFHPIKELPVMREWFHKCRNPSRRTLQMYVDILNQAPVRQQERPKISLSTLKNWWKNEKQRERKNLKSDDKSDSESGSTVKRKKKSNDSNELAKGGSSEIMHSFSGTNSDDVPSTGSFTLINHSENESDLERFSRKEGDISENSSLVSDSDHHFPRSSPSEMSKNNCKFTLLSHVEPDGEVVRYVRKESELNENIRPSDNALQVSKISIPDHTSIFHKLHTVHMEQNHGLFGFTEHPLSVQNTTKVFCDNAMRTNVIEGGNSHLSSEEDVDVGI